MMKSNFVVMVLALIALVGCEKKQEWRQERLDGTYQAAMADYSAGRLEEAIKGFEKVIRKNPYNASARFQLACLLQDSKHDYLGALSCYREYLLREPTGEKSKLAKDRAALCQKLLECELSRDAATLAKLEAIEADSKKREIQLNNIKKTLSKAEEENTTLKKENARLRRMLGAIGSEDEPQLDSSLISARELLDEEDEDDLKISSDKKENSEPRNIAIGAKEVAKSVEEDEKVLSSALLKRDDKKESSTKLLDIGKKSDKKEEVLTRPEFYIVEEGDTLYKISLKFYGRRDAWKRILEANKATVSSDARIRPGQKLRLP